VITSNLKDVQNQKKEIWEGEESLNHKINSYDHPTRNPFIL